MYDDTELADGVVDGAGRTGAFAAAIAGPNVPKSDLTVSRGVAPCAEPSEGAIPTAFKTALQALVSWSCANLRMFAWAAVTHDARKAGGMDQALSVVRRSPFGDVLLTVIAVGIACFGLYCFVWARHPRRD